MDEAARNDSFYRNLAFGTGGLRGVLGAGTNRMNLFTVMKATRGLGRYLKETFPAPSCAISFDSRIHSEDFARLTLVRDGEPCYYLYRLSGNGHSQTGIVAAFSIDDYETGTIRRHEFTRPVDEKDRADHIATTGCQTGPVLLAYRDDPTLETIVNAAYSQLGVGYSYGASSPGVAFDCSGLTSWCYAQAGISIPHSSAGQAGCITSTGNLQPGDLVVWLGGVDSGSGNHVALYVGNDQIIHANGSYVKLDSLSGRSGYTVAGSVL